MRLANVKTAILAKAPAFVTVWARRLESSPIGRRVSRGAFWSLSGAVISRVLTQIGYIVAARLLGQKGYGELAVIESTVGMFSSFAGFGLGLAATNKVAAFRRTDPARVSRVLALSRVVALGTGFLAATTLLLLAPWLAQRTLAAPQLSGQLRIASLFVLLSAINGVQTGALLGFEAFKSIAFLGSLSGIISLPLLVVGAWKLGLTGAVCAMAANNLINVVLANAALRRQMRSLGRTLGFVGWMSEWRVLVSHSLPMVLVTTFIAPVAWIANMILVNQPGGYEQMGVYNAANRWYGVLLFLPSTLLQPLLPVLSEEFAKDERQRIARVFRMSTLFSMGMVAPFVLGLSVLSPVIMQLYGHAFEAGWPILCVLLCTALVYTFHMNVYQCIFAAGRLWLVFNLQISWGLTYLGVTFLLHHHGALSLAASQLAAYLVSDSLAFIGLRHILHAPTATKRSQSIYAPETGIPTP
jgi:O-antigen/teichoic acid export membrane protein